MVTLHEGNIQKTLISRRLRGFARGVECELPGNLKGSENA